MLYLVNYRFYEYSIECIFGSIGSNKIKYDTQNGNLFLDVTRNNRMAIQVTLAVRLYALISCWEIKCLADLLGLNLMIFHFV